MAWTVTSNGQSADHVGIKDGIYKGLVLIYKIKKKKKKKKKKKTETEAGQEKLYKGWLS